MRRRVPDVARRVERDHGPRCYCTARRRPCCPASPSTHPDTMSTRQRSDAALGPDRRGGPGHARDVREGRHRGRATCARSTMPTSRSPRSSCAGGPSPSATSAGPVSAGRPSRRRRSRSPAAEAGALGAAYDRSSDLGTAVGDLLASVGHAPPAGRARSRSWTTADRLRGPRRGARQRGQAGHPRRALRALPTRSRRATSTAILTGELRIGLREGHLEAGIAAAFGRELEAVQWAGMLSGDIGRTAVLARQRRARRAPSWRSSIRSSRCSPRPSPTRPRRWPACRRPSGSRTSTTASAPSSTRRARGRLFSRDLNDVTGQFPEVVAGGRGAALGRHPRRRAPGLAGRRRAAVPAAPVATRPQGAVGGHPGAGPGHLRRLRRARPGRPAQAREPLLRLPLRERRATGWRRSASTAPRLRAGGARGRARRRRARAASSTSAQARGNEGLMLKDPDSIYAPGPARLRLAEAEEGAHDARLRRRRRRGRARPTPRRPLGLHVRGPRRPTGGARRASSSRSARPTAV